MTYLYAAVHIFIAAMAVVVIVGSAFTLEQALELLLHTPAAP